MSPSLLLEIHSFYRPRCGGTILSFLQRSFSHYTKQGGSADMFGPRAVALGLTYMYRGIWEEGGAVKGRDECRN